MALERASNHDFSRQITVSQDLLHAIQGVANGLTAEAAGRAYDQKPADVLGHRAAVKELMRYQGLIPEPISDYDPLSVAVVYATAHDLIAPPRTIYPARGHLTSAQTVTLGLMVAGYNDDVIQRLLNLLPGSLYARKGDIYRRLGAQSKHNAVAIGAQALKEAGHLHF